MELIEIAINNGISTLIVIVLYLSIKNYLDGKNNERTIKISEKFISDLNEIVSYIKKSREDYIYEKDALKVKTTYLTFDRFQNNLIRFFIETIHNNHIDINRENIEANIKEVVTTECYNIYKDVMSDSNRDSLLTVINNDWIEESIDDIKAFLYMDGDNVYKINSYINRLRIRTKAYSTDVFKIK